eukprot:2418617-Rhodomonas_salina.1
MARSAAAVARRAEKRGRPVEEQKKIDRETAKKQDAARKEQEKTGGGDQDEWNSYLALVREFKESQGKKWLGIVPKKLRLQTKAVGQ